MKDAKYVESEPVVYSDTELKKFFKECKDDKFLTAVYKTLLMSGLRKQELESLTWDDVDFEEERSASQRSPDSRRRLGKSAPSRCRTNC